MISVRDGALPFIEPRGLLFNFRSLDPPGKDTERGEVVQSLFPRRFREFPVLVRQDIPDCPEATLAECKSPGVEIVL